MKKSSAAAAAATKKAVAKKVAAKPVKAVAKKVAAVKAPVKAAPKKTVVTKKAPVKAAVKAPVKKAQAKALVNAPVKKSPAKAAAKKAVAVKAPAKAAGQKAFARAPAKTASKATPKAPASKKSEGKTINELITPREMEIKSTEELLGIKKFEDTRNKPIIPGKFDLILPPGTPRKLIITLAKEFDVEIVTRTDVYVPIGICDIQRELLAIRGDEKTIRKFEKIVLNKLKEIAADGGVGPNASYDERVKASKSAKTAVAKKVPKAKA